MNFAQKMHHNYEEQPHQASKHENELADLDKQKPPNHATSSPTTTTTTTAATTTTTTTTLSPTTVSTTIASTTTKRKPKIGKSQTVLLILIISHVNYFSFKSIEEEMKNK